MTESLVFLNTYSIYQLLLIAVLFLAFLAFSLLGLRRVKSWQRRILLFSLRLLVALLCVFIVLQPGIEKAKIVTVRGRVAILMDVSESMSLPAYPEKRPRIEAAKEFLSGAGDLIASLKKDNDLEIYAFSDRAQASSLDALPSLKAQGKGTDLANSLRDVEKKSDQKLVGVILLSDGNDHGEIGRTFGSLPAGSPLRFDFPALIYTYGLADQKAFRDNSIREVRSGGFGFAKTPIEIIVKVSSQGYSTKLPVVLREAGEIIASKSLNLTPDARDYEVRLSFIPQRVGKAIYTAEIPVLADEAVPDNNSKSFVVNVIRDKTRVLQIAGRPSWDERFLRQILKNDPGIDLVSFMILRTPLSLVTDIRSLPIPVEELSLIPFPTVDIFEKGLPGFDIVIFQNFDCRPYVPFQYLNFLKDYVEKGGAFIMIGGDQSFSAGGYGGTPTEEILPNRLGIEALREGKSGWVGTEELSLKLTSAGKEHPIMRLDPDRKKNEKIWSSLPNLSGINRVQGLRAGALVLAEGQAGSTPIISVREAAKGRSLAIATDSLWKWAFGGDGDRLYRAFWKNAISWLVKEPSYERIRMIVEKDSYQKNETIVLEVLANDPFYRPVKGGLIEVELNSPSKKAIVVKADERKDGRYEAKIKLDEPGLYQAKVRLQGAGGQGRAETAFVVEGRNLELEDLSVNEELLRGLAEATGGKYMLIQDKKEKIAFPPPERVKGTERERRPIWDSPWLYLPVVFLFCVEWFLRRRSSLP